MKVYVFTAEQVFDGEVLDLIVYVFYTIKEAQKCMRWFVKDVKESVKELGWDVEENEPDFYRACGSDYAANHCEFMITKKDVLNKFEI